MEEIWKDIKGFEGIYQVSNLGRVKGLHGFKKQGFTKDYPSVALYKKNRRSIKRVNVLVAEAFITNTHNYRQVRNIDGDAYNNIVTNLEWCSSNVKHGYYGTRVYRIWNGIKRRCLSPDDTSYENYGGRGIKICDEWKNSSAMFIEWALSHGYTDELTIDRIDVNGDYCPENCRWVTYREQGKNKRNNRLITYNGETHCLSEWAEIMNMTVNTIESRLLKGWDIEKVFQKEVRNTGHYQLEYKGKIYNLQELARELKINPLTLKYRLKKGMSIEQAIKKEPFETHRTPIKQLDIYGNFIKEYPSIKAAVKETGIKHIHKVLDMKNKTAGGYRWERIK